MDIRALGYLILSSPQVDEWSRYGQEVLGMMAGADSGDRLFLRIDDRPYRVAVQPGDTESVLAIGWEVATSAALETAATELEAAGVEVERDTGALAKERRVTDVLSFVPPGGQIRHEVFVGPELDYTPFVSPTSVSGFVTGDLGFGHVVLGVPDLKEAEDFYVGTMGFRLTDSMTLGGNRVLFLHCNGRHHSLAIGQAPAGAPPLNHIMLEVDSIDDVGHALDRIADRGVRLRQGLGRHTNDEMVSFYVATPGGFSVEYGYGARVVDDATWLPSETTRGSYWGHRDIRRPKAAEAR